MTEPSRTRSRVMLVLIAAVFFGPLLVATWLYYGGATFQPEGRVNHGALLEPIVNVTDVVPDVPLEAGGHWWLVYQDLGPCEDACREGLYTIRQSRLMLGREMDRVERMFLHGAEAPDTLFLEEQHKGLVALENGGLSALLANKKPEGLAAGGYYLIDPLGNLVMYFPPDIVPGDMVDDLKRLLKLSRIG